jgi:glycosyltransferase involved in cell wall biosynthesis
MAVQPPVPQHDRAHARNAALGKARGTYLAFQDSDDEWHPEKLQRQILLLETHKEVSVVYSDMHRVYSDGRVLLPSLAHDCARPAHQSGDAVLAKLYAGLAQRYEFLHQKEPLVKYYETFGITADHKKELKSRRQLLRKYARPLLESDPTFILKETVDVLLRNSLMPRVNDHIVAM